MRGWTPDHIRASKDIVKSLQSARKLYDYTQEGVAYDLGKSQSWLSDIERGKSDISLSDACMLANVYGLEIRLCDRG